MKQLSISTFGYTELQTGADLQTMKQLSISTFGYTELQSKLSVRKQIWVIWLVGTNNNELWLAHVTILINI